MRCSKRCFVSAPAAFLSVILVSGAADAQIFGGSYAGHYTATQLAPVPGLPGFYGGMVLELGHAMTLLIGGNADTSLGAIYAVDLTRDAFGHIDGFSGLAVKRADAPFIDGGLTYGPGGVLLYTASPTNMLGQIPPGATAPTKTTLLSGLGVGGSVGGCAVVVNQLNGLRLKVTSPGLSRWYDMPLSNDAFGTFNVGLANPHGPVISAAGNMVYVPAGHPGFAVDTVLVASCNGSIGAYSVDGNADAFASLGSFVLSIAGCVDGLCVDPLTGDLLLCLTTSKKIFVVRGFTATATFCEPLSSTGTCAPRVAWSGTPTLSGADDFVVRADDAPTGRNGIEIWSLETRQEPFASGFLCVAQPLHRIHITSTAGGGTSPNCDGVLSQAWTHSFLHAQALSAGVTVYTQFVMRDHASTLINSLLISDALRFTLAN